MSAEVCRVQDMDVLFFSLQYHQIQYFPSKAIFAIRRIIQLVCFLQQVQHQVLDSLVVRISACHVEGPGSIPGRGGNILTSLCSIIHKIILLQVRLELTTPAFLNVLSISTVR